MLPRWVLQRALRGSGSRAISFPRGQLSRSPCKVVTSNGIHGSHGITRKRWKVAKDVHSYNLQSRGVMTTAIPTLAIPPLMFVGLLLGLWTWKCFWIIIMQNKLLYLSWLPPFTRSEAISDYETECRPVQWEEKQVRSLDGTKLAICEGHIPVHHRQKEKEPLVHPGASAVEDRGAGSTRKKSVVICYFQGNGGSTPMRLPLLSHILRAIGEISKSETPPACSAAATEYSVVALSYRGYWTSSGRATQSGIEMDAQAFLAWASEFYTTPETDVEIVAWGHSLGAAVASSAVATYLPRQHQRQTTSDTSSNKPLAPISRIILEAPTSSIKDMLISLYPQKWLPYRYLWPFSWNTWDIKSSMQQMATWRDQPDPQASNSEDTKHTRTSARLLPPIFLISAEKDEVIPSYVPEQLEKHAKSLHLEIETKNVLGAMHIEAPLKLDGRRAMVNFILKGSPAPNV